MDPAFQYFQDEFGFQNSDLGQITQGTTQVLHEGVYNHGNVNLGENAQGISGVPAAPVQGDNVIYGVSCELGEDHRQENSMLTKLQNVFDDAETSVADSSEASETAEMEDYSSAGPHPPIWNPDGFAPEAFIPAEQQQQQLDLPPIGAIQAFVSDRPFLGLGPPESIEVGQFTGYWDPTRNLMTFVPVPGQGPMQQPAQHHFA
ncbi:MAG: hypothetical protein Q9212_006216, partial [Teloschistes hypoglaucus]